MALVSTLIADGKRLADRVERLLAAGLPVVESRAWPEAWLIAAWAATSVIALVFHPASLRGVHAMIEWVMR